MPASESSLQASVIVCTYRREEPLRQLLEDLLAQEGVSCEVIVVDQTPRHEPETQRFFAERAGGLVLLRVPEPNLPAARNHGLRVARGEVAVFVDDDLRIPSDFLARLVRRFEEDGVDAAAPVVAQPEDPADALVQRFFGFREGWQERERIAVERVIGACMAFRRRLVEDLGGFEALMGRLNPSASGEDFEFCARWRRAGHAIWLLPGLRVLHLADTPGGCDVRTQPLSESRRQQLRANTFVVLKQEGAFERLTARSLLRLLRVGVVRRDVLGLGPLEAVRAVARLRRAVGDVREFWREQQGGDGALDRSGASGSP